MPHFQCTADNSLLLIIDVQERFVSAIPDIAPEAGVGQALATLCAGCSLLGVPSVITRQYPKGLGDTLPHLRAIEPAAGSTGGDKTHFSVLDDEALRHVLADSERDVVIVAGIEAHVCVLATVADLSQRGYQVLVAGDAIASRRNEHCAMAQTAMTQLGALVLPVESILFRLQRQAGVGSFKALSQLVK